MISIGIVHLVFFVLGNYFVNKLGNERLLKIKMIFEYTLIILIIYFILGLKTRTTPLLQNLFLLG